MSGGGQGGSMPGMGTFGDVADLSGHLHRHDQLRGGRHVGRGDVDPHVQHVHDHGRFGDASGTLSARSWPGYTALSMRFGDTLPATIISTRAWHRGNSLRIQSVRGESRAFTFNGRSDAGGGAAQGRTPAARRPARAVVAVEAVAVGAAPRDDDARRDA
jgi:hypothetical protein